MLPSHMEMHDFGNRLHQLLSPAQPIQSVEFLQGRTEELSRIEKALFASGRHIFIFGDRGVGKSSLAAAAANQTQSSDAEYLDIPCAADDTLKSIVANIAYKTLAASRLRKTKFTANASVEFRYLKAGLTREITSTDLHNEIRTIGDAVEVLREVAALHSQRPVVVLDEFDRMADEAERNKFADLVKQIGDKKINITFFFTGVGHAVDALLGSHPSAIRQFETIELPKLSWTARWDIALNATNALGLDLDERTRFRLAAVSDGYPYYVHLITEKLLWRVYEDPAVITNITWEHYFAALNDAIVSINAELRRPYEMASSQRSDDYEEVLWAVADSEFLDRNLKQIYSSYTYVMGQRTGRTTLSYDGFTAMVRKLRNKSCGEILVPSRFNRPGWIAYRESLLRGYARMQAEAHGIELVGDRQEAPKQKMHVAASAGRGYYGSSIPKGVMQGRKREQNTDEEAE